MKKLMSLLLVVLMAVALLPAAALASYASGPEGNTYGYAYDAQRSPAWPESGETITLDSWKYPYLSSGSQASSYAGSWTLTNQNTFAYCKSVGKSTDGLENVVNQVASQYGLTADNIIVHELKNGGAHVAYGVTIAYDASRGIAMFIGDSLYRGAGYVLSVGEVTEDSVTAMANVSVGDWTPPPTYDITIGTMENGSVTAPVTKAMAGDTIKLTVSPAAGYELSSLTVTAADNNSVSVSGTSFNMPAQAVTVNAGFALKSYTVTYKAEDGSTVDSVTVKHGQNVPEEDIPAVPAKTGYDQTAPAWNHNGQNITADTIITPVYTINKYTVTYKAEDGSTVATTTVEHGKDVAAEDIPSVPAKTGYDQTAPSWNHNGKNITADTTITASYTINKYSVTYMADGDQVGQTQTVEHGGNATAPAVPAKTGYTGAWSSDGKSITADTTITANYTINKYSVTYMADGEQVGETQTVEHGGNATAPAVPAKTGYTGAWSSDGKNITADTTITANYTINKYSVTYMADGVQVGQTQTVEHGGHAVAPEIPAKAGYMAQWSADGKNITANTTIEAVYTAIPVEPPVSDIPATGDERSVLLWGGMLLALGAAVVVTTGKKKHSN